MLSRSDAVLQYLMCSFIKVLPRRALIDISARGVCTKTVFLKSANSYAGVFSSSSKHIWMASVDWILWRGRDNSFPSCVTLNLTRVLQMLKFRAIAHRVFFGDVESRMCSHTKTLLQQTLAPVRKHPWRRMKVAAERLGGPHEAIPHAIGSWSLVTHYVHNW